jgi:hypothetical protein
MASLIADELQIRARLHAVPAADLDLRQLRDQFENAPFVVTTPFCTQLTSLQSAFRTVVQATLAPELLDALRTTLRRPRALVVAPCEAIAVKIRRAIDQGQLGSVQDPPTVVNAQGENDIAQYARNAQAILVWPGCSAHVDRQLEPFNCTRPERLLSEPCLSAIRAAILDSAMARFAASTTPSITRSNGDGVRRISAGVTRPAVSQVLESGLRA